MITLPLFPSELHAVPKIPEHEMSAEKWIASTEALPADGITVLCFLPSKQTHRHYPTIHRLHLQDGQWIAGDWEWLEETHFPVEAVQYWCAIETPPTVDDLQWNTNPIYTEQEELRSDIWIWNDQRQQVYQFWCEAEFGSDIGNRLYYGSAGDPVLHDEYVTKWMKCVQPEDPSIHFQNHFSPCVWQEVRRRPEWLSVVEERDVGRKTFARLWWKSNQYKMDL